MNNNPTIMTDEQYEFCKLQANKLAKVIMDMNVEDIFGEDGNANFVLETILILASGTVVILAEKINIDPLDLLIGFYYQAKKTIESNQKKSFLTLVN